MEKVADKLMRGAAWIIAARIFTNLVGLASTIILARLLLPSDFGIVAMATTILAVAQSVTDLSLTSALIQRKNVDEEHFHTVWTIGLLRSAGIVVIISLAAYPLSRLYGDPQLFEVLLATGVIAAIPGLSSPRLVMMTKNLVFWQGFVVQVTERVLVLLVSGGIAVLTHSYWALLAGSFVGAISAVTLSYLLAPYRPHLSFSRIGDLFAYSFWLSVGGVVNSLNWKLDQIVLGYLVGKGPFGIYTMADRLSALPVHESIAPLSQTLFPALARIADDPDRLRKGYLRAQGIVCAIALPIGFGFALVADPVVRLLLGQKWLLTIPIIQILSGTFALQSLSNGLQPLAMAANATKKLFGRDLRTFFIRVPFIIGGYMLGGLLGVVIGRSISSFIGTIWNMALVTKLTGLSMYGQFEHFSRALAATGIMIAITLALQHGLTSNGGTTHFITILLSVLVGGGVYIGSSALLWRLMSRPDGPEMEAGKIAATFMASIR